MRSYRVLSIISYCFLRETVFRILASSFLSFSLCTHYIILYDILKDYRKIFVEFFSKPFCRSHFASQDISWEMEISSFPHLIPSKHPSPFSFVSFHAIIQGKDFSFLMKGEQFLWYGLSANMQFYSSCRSFCW